MSLTFTEVATILEDPRTRPLGHHRFQIEEQIYTLDPLDLQVYRDGAMRQIGEDLMLRKRPSVWRGIWSTIRDEIERVWEAITTVSP